MRGKPLSCRQPRLLRRIIPARAGQTWRTGPRCRRWPDHPRACGANVLVVGSAFQCHGSSPRVRGKQVAHPCERPPIRIIPARAGQTASLPKGFILLPDHPRACGANPDSGGMNTMPNRSSPRVRGKPIVWSGLFLRRRIIPARAGQTQWREPEHNAPADHPRACGANSNKGSATVSASGSSPRVRGKRERVGGDGTAMRIIPARAGQTQGRDRTRIRHPDHPRACGANNIQDKDGVLYAGSSPRVRGKPFACGALFGHERIIPARAGQTTRHPGCCRTPTDHPRACGANCIKAETREGFIGSSPRVRGKPEELVVPVDCRRIIPARAGQTQTDLG